MVSLAGEEEPYVALSGNGYGLTSDYDGFTRLENPSLFRQLIEEEVANPSSWSLRLRLQYKGQRLAHLLNYLVYDGNIEPPSQPEQWLRRHGLWGHYDGCAPSERIPFTEIAYEMPPFVLPKPVGYVNEGSTLLLKSPYHCYRPGILQQAFPDIPVQVVRILRNPAATINGLIAGWQAPYGFHKHLLSQGWWKFDLPPDWRDVAHATIPERAWFQWKSSTKALLYIQTTLTIKLEDLLADPVAQLRRICNRIDLEPPPLATDQLAVVMATEQPEPFRWHKRRAVIEPLLTRSPSTDLIKDFGYDDVTRWS